MSLFAFARCPSCGSDLPVAELWRVACKPRDWFVPRSSALTCDACHEKLRVVQWRGYLAVLAIFALTLVAGFVVNDAYPKGDERRMLTLPLVIVAGVLLSLLPRRLARFRVARPDEKLNFALDKARATPPVPMAPDAEDEPEFDPEVADGKPWKCLRCGEENPGEFSLCWNCVSVERAGQREVPLK